MKTKTIYFIENTVFVSIGGCLYACEFDIDGNDERDSDISVDELSNLDWIDWETAVEGAERKELKKFTLDEVEEITLDEDGEVIDRRLIGYHNPSHMIYYGSTYGWEPLKGEN